MGLGGSISNHSIAFCKYSSHNGIFCGGYAGFIHEKIRTVQALRGARFKRKPPIIFDMDTKSSQCQNMCIKTAAPNDISAGRRQFEISKARGQRSSYQDGSANAAA